MTRKCLFCQGNNLSNEHIFAQWLLKELGLESSKVGMVHMTFFGAPVSEREHNYLSLVNGRVCEKCNNGWMNDLEIECKPHVIGLMNMENFEEELQWLKNNSEVFSRWAFKNVILLNNASNFWALVPESHFQSLYNGKIPKNVFITVSFCENERGLNWRQSQGLKFVCDKKVKLPLKNRRYNITFRVNHLMVKVRYFDYDEIVQYDDSDCIIIAPDVGPYIATKGFMHKSIDEFDISGTVYVG